MLTIDTQGVLRYVNNQITIISAMPESDFKKGVIEGLNLVKEFIELYQEKEGTKIAKEAGE